MLSSYFWLFSILVSGKILDPEKYECSSQQNPSFTPYPHQPPSDHFKGLQKLNLELSGIRQKIKRGLFSVWKLALYLMHLLLIIKESMRPTFSTTAKKGWHQFETFKVIKECEGRRGAGIRGWTHRLAEPGYVISILSKGNQAKRLINPNLFSQLAFRVP